MKGLDQRVQKTINLFELEADFFTSFEYDEHVTLICSHDYFARASAVPSLFAVQSTGGPSPDFTNTLHGETPALPGGSKKTVYVDNVACGPRVCDLRIRTAGEDSPLPEQLAELAPDSFKGRVDIPSSRPSGDYGLLADS